MLQLEFGGDVEMAEISIAGAVGEGFGLIGRKPVTVMVWGLVRVAFAVGLLAAMAPLFIGVLEQVFIQAEAGPTAAPNPALISQVMNMQALSYLLQIASLFLESVLLCAVFRAVLHPERGRFAYLRIGAAEFFLAVLFIAGAIALVFGILLVMIPFAIIIGILAATHAAVAAAAVGVLAFLSIFVGLIYLGVRFAFVGPMIVDDGKFHLFESWTLTRGHAGRLFLIGLCLVGILFLAELVLGAAVLALGAAGLGVAAGGFNDLPGFFRQPPGVIVSKLAPFLVVYVLAAIPLTGCFLAIVAAPWARAYRDLVAADASAPFA
jgi:hypothetical protein